MEPVTVILTALAAGALGGATDAAQTAIKDAYQGLKSLILGRFGEDHKATSALDMFESNPDETIATYLRPHLIDYELAADPEITAAAEDLLALTDSPAATGAGSTVITGQVAQFADRGGVAQIGGNVGSISTSFTAASDGNPRGLGKPRA